MADGKWLLAAGAEGNVPATLHSESWWASAHAGVHGVFYGSPSPLSPP